MKNLCSLVVFLLISPVCFSQLTDLCGIWIGKTYQCFTVDSTGTVNFYYTDEVVLIEQNGALTTATKITGDNCVTAGTITWQGNYTTNPFNISGTIGTPNFPNSTQVSSTATVVDSTYIQTNFSGVNFRKATCKQIDSLHIDLASLKRSCLACESKATEVSMPNVFTPNNDGVNDVFLPIIKGTLKESELLVYNRWGKLIFKTNELKKGWNGQTGNESCTDGIYFWIYTYTPNTGETEMLKGHVTLFQ